MTHPLPQPHAAREPCGKGEAKRRKIAKHLHPIGLPRTSSNDFIRNIGKGCVGIPAADEDSPSRRRQVASGSHHRETNDVGKTDGESQKRAHKTSVPKRKQLRTETELSILPLKAR